MHRNSYAREVGIEADDCVVPLPYALLLLAVLAFGAWRGAGILQARVDQRHEVERLSAAAQAPTPARVALARE